MVSRYLPLMRVRRQTVRTVGRAWLATLCALLVVLGSLAAGQSWRAVAQPVRLVRAVPDTALRAGPGPAVLPLGDQVTAAPPFRFGPATMRDRARALECLTAALYYEAGAEGDAGQAAVAQVVLNRVRHPAFPATVCGVVYQGAGRVGCQFSFACDGALARVPAARVWARAARIAAMALAGRVDATVGLATHYHTFAVTPGWNRGLVMTAMVGAHFFHRWKGPAGTAAAFSRRYTGGEPDPWSSPPDDPVLPMLAAERPAPSLSPAEPSQDRLPPAPAVLERWKDSGQPLATPRGGT